MQRRVSVREGQRYAQRFRIKNRPAIWKVGSVKESGSIPHARLVNVEDPLQTKTISCVTLISGSLFELVADSPVGTG